MSTAKTVVVTGGSGKAGRACIAELLGHGYRVVNVDTARPVEGAPACPFVLADLADYGQAAEVLSRVDGRIGGGFGPVEAVVHLAAIPAQGIHTNATTFRVNTLSTYNVFEAARQAGIRNVVWASSETVLGLPFEEPPPYVPVDEEYAGRPESAYSLSKLLGEEMAEQFCRWDKEMKIIGLRFSNIMEPQDYARFEGWQDDGRKRRWNLWGYIDARDAAQAVRLSLESSLTGAHVFVIANGDTVMRRGNAELLAEQFPGVAMRRAVGPNETLLGIEKARRVLGFEPRFNWAR